MYQQMGRVRLEQEQSDCTLGAKEEKLLCFAKSDRVKSTLANLKDKRVTLNLCLEKTKTSRKSQAVGKLKKQPGIRKGQVT